MPERNRPAEPAPHECDLFLLSSARAYTAENALGQFVRLGGRNLHGWGLGLFQDGRARVVRRSTPALQPGGAVAESFAAAMEAAASPVLVGHLRAASGGRVVRENNHPFTMSFLGHDWVFAHNGTASRRLVADDEILLRESTVDSARAFEFVRREMIGYFPKSPARSLLEAVRRAFGRLLEHDPGGTYNLVLSNGTVSFVLVHHRPFHLLLREKAPGDALLLSTLRLTGDEPWHEFDHRRGPRLLVISGPSLLYNCGLERRAGAEGSGSRPVPGRS